MIISSIKLMITLWLYVMYYLVGWFGLFFKKENMMMLCIKLTWIILVI